VRVGLKLNAPIGPVSWTAIREMASTAEEGGLDSLWSEDHHFEPFGGPWDVWTVLAALAASTSRVELAPIVASTNYYPSPVILARKAATVDEISGGRLILGLGAGSGAFEYPRLGLPFDHPVSRFEEAFEIIRRLLAGERFDYEGRFHRLEDAWLSPVHRLRSLGFDEERMQPTRWLDDDWETQPTVPLEIPIMAGTLGPRMLGIMLPHSSGWNVHWGDEPFMNNPENLPGLHEWLDERCREAGRDPASVWRSAEVYVPFDGARGLPVPVPDELAPLPPDAETLHRLEAVGVDHAIVLADPQTPEAVEELCRMVEEYRATTGRGQSSSPV
jgi:alkanesulfonate monooxygenase SsuD/methylene tetrahydromethanopterin reductase-like flavin-dependent oxidoreductase (luciferase family)